MTKIVRTGSSSVNGWHINYHSQVRNDIFHLLPDGCHSILEIGLGTGATISAIKKFKKISFSAGVEINEAAANIACEYVDEVVLGDIERMEIPVHWINFDVILCLDILEHLVDPWNVVHRLHERLKPGGVLIASVPNIGHYAIFFELAFRGKWELRDAGILDRTHLRFFVRKTVEELMTCSGLKLDRVEAGGTPRGSKRWWAIKISAGVLERFLARQYYVRVVNA